MQMEICATFLIRHMATAMILAGTATTGYTGIHTWLTTGASITGTVTLEHG